jgi:hypothetical protein
MRYLTICAIGVLFCSKAVAWTTLDMPGATLTEAHGIDGSNVVGTYQLNGVNHGFTYDGAWATLDMSGPVTGTTLTGISGNNIVGYYTGSIGDIHACFYNGTNWKTIDVSGAYRTDIGGIDGGLIVGDYLDSSDNSHGFIYDGTHWTTKDMPGTSETQISGINGNYLVGRYWDSVGKIHGFYYDGANWNTLDMPGADSTWVFGYDNGLLVGQSITSGRVQSFIYDLHTMTTLDFPISNCQNSIFGISGNNVVGDFDANLTTHGFLYTVPEPASFLLLVLGSVLLKKHST